jgi:chorismate--pyruvate lyase
MTIKQSSLLPIQGNVPKKLLPWLSYVDFLTAKLKTEVGDARLEVLDQRWASVGWWEQFILQIKDERVLQREILMWAFDQPCWYARTIIPATTYQADQTLFERLRKESLGHLIFNGTSIKRHQKINYLINQESIEYHWLNEHMHQQRQELWVRLSEFLLHDTWSFFLVEILLPGLENVLP